MRPEGGAALLHALRASDARLGRRPRRRETASSGASRSARSARRRKRRLAAARPLPDHRRPARHATATSRASPPRARARRGSRSARIPNLILGGPPRFRAARRRGQPPRVRAAAAPRARRSRCPTARRSTIVRGAGAYLYDADRARLPRHGQQRRARRPLPPPRRARRRAADGRPQHQHALPPPLDRRATPSGSTATLPDAALGLLLRLLRQRGQRARAADGPRAHAEGAASSSWTARTTATRRA